MIKTNLEARAQLVATTIEAAVEECTAKANAGFDHTYIMIPKGMYQDVMNVLREKHGVFQRSMTKLQYIGDQIEVTVGWHS